jgi:hypothetical protein
VTSGADARHAAELAHLLDEYVALALRVLQPLTEAPDLDGDPDRERAQDGHDEAEKRIAARQAGFDSAHQWFS